MNPKMDTKMRKRIEMPRKKPMLEKAMAVKNPLQTGLFLKIRLPIIKVIITPIMREFGILLLVGFFVRLIYLLF